MFFPLLALQLGYCYSLLVKGSIQLPASTPAHEYPEKVLIDGLREAFLSNELAFQVDLPPGSHTLQVVSVFFEFDRIRIDIPSQTSSSQTKTETGSTAAPTTSDSVSDISPSFYLCPIGWDFSALGPQLLTLDSLPPRARLDFFTPRPSFNIWSLLGNPMLLMSAVSLGMVVLIPKMKDAITDPELLKEMEERQKKNPGNPAGLPEMPDFASNFADYFSKQQQQVRKKKD